MCESIYLCIIYLYVYLYIPTFIYLDIYIDIGSCDCGGRSETCKREAPAGLGTAALSQKAA